MGRELKRVPLDFDYPLNKVWYGYFINSISTCLSDGDKDYCVQCKEFAKKKGIPSTDCECPDMDEYLKAVKEKLRELCEPPKGDGYQLWETTSEGSPVSPVFETLEELCEWCEENATTYGSLKASKEVWEKMLLDDFLQGIPEEEKMFYCEKCGAADACERTDLVNEPVLCDKCYGEEKTNRSVDYNKLFAELEKNCISENACNAFSCITLGELIEMNYLLDRLIVFCENVDQEELEDNECGDQVLKLYKLADELFSRYYQVGRERN